MTLIDSVVQGFSGLQGGQSRRSRLASAVSSLVAEELRHRSALRFEVDVDYQ